MDDRELANRVVALPDRFADRLDERGLRFARSAAGAGEWGEAVDLIVAGLVKTAAPVTVAERDDLLHLVEAMQLKTTDPLDNLTVQG